jgi:hypothetical protein
MSGGVKMLSTRGQSDNFRRIALEKQLLQFHKLDY